MLKRILLAAFILSILIGLLVYSQNKSVPLKVSGFVEADEIRVGSRVGGRVAEVLVEEGNTVEPNTTLLRLDPFDLLQRLAEAEAQMAVQQAQLDKLQNGFRPEEIGQAKARVDRLSATLRKLKDGPRLEQIAAAKSQVTLAEAQAERASRTYERTKQLFERTPPSVAREEFERAVEDFKVSQATLQVRREELQLLEKGTREEEIAEASAQLDEATQAFNLAVIGFRKEEIAQAAAAVSATRAAASAVQIQLSELEVKSNVRGVVQALQLRPGDLVPANSPVLSLLDMDRIWIRAYVPDDLLKVGVGQSVYVTLDSLPGERLKGEVTFVATQAEFTPRNVQTPEERSRQVFRIKVRLRDPIQHLRSGMAADIWLNAKE